jgi:telomerase protein component 1
VNRKYRAQGLEWLPLASQARIVVSAEDDDNMAFNALRFKRITQLSLPPLPEKEQKELVRQTLWDYRKRLDELSSNNQMRSVIKKTDGQKPLFLMIACEELRVFGVFEKVNDRIKQMSSTVPKLLDEVLVRLEKEHGKDLMKQALSLLLVARDGLLESEMLALLGTKGVDLPRTTWAALFRSLQAYLRPASENGESTLDFFHRQMARAVRKRYILRDQEVKVHQALAKFFLAKLDPTGEHKFEGNYPRAVSELPYHLCEARMWGELNALLCSVTFVEAKATYALVLFSFLFIV